MFPYQSILELKSYEIK